MTPIENKPKKSFFKKAALVFGIIVLLMTGTLGFLLASEYKPAPEESLALNGTANSTLAPGQSFTVTSWNIGYGGLDASSDFFMDGGKTVNPDSKEHVQNTVNQLAHQIEELDSDIFLLQETDINSHRSFHINQAEQIQNTLEQHHDVQSAFAYNFNVTFIPYPLPPIGHVESGVLTLNSFQADSATRIAFDSSFKWPVSAFQLKRGLLVERMPLENSDKELVLINLHLEAYDNGHGKAQQAAKLAQIMNDEYEKGNYVIAGGDFNSVLPGVNPDLYPLENTEYFMPAVIESTLLPEGWQYITDDSVPTARLLNHPYDASKPDDNQFYVIDGFILSPNVTLHQAETADYQFAWSDHNPVSIEVELNA
ncbi:MAG: endonuclease/exonuclease/phosphatase family protein [Peptococcaceae bacterium]|nr:endonuclease/exonuclease/phosphatase family protein [Peptococcaceae bacterium]